MVAVWTSLGGVVKIGPDYPMVVRTWFGDRGNLRSLAEEGEDSSLILRAPAILCSNDLQGKDPVPMDPPPQFVLGDLEEMITYFK